MTDHCIRCNTDDALSIPVVHSTGKRTLILQIENMDCPLEERLIRKTLSGQAGIDDLNFDLLNCTLTVFHQLDKDASILAALASIGMQAVVMQNGYRKKYLNKKYKIPGSISRQQWMMTIIAGMAAIGSEVLAYITSNEISWWVAILALITVIASGLPVLKKGWIALKMFTLNINLLMSVAVLGAVIIGQWPEAAVVIWLFSIAELIEKVSLDRARNALRSLVELAPNKVVVRQPDHSWMIVDAEAVALGSIVRVRPSERIALDGIVVHGESSVNQAPITGESIPVTKQRGDTLFAGTLNERGLLEFCVTAIKGENILDRIARSVQEAQNRRAPIQRFIDHFAQIYTPVIFIMALLAASIVPLLLNQPWFDWIYRALVLLVIACPCALVISTPVTIVSGLTAAARRGIVIKGGLYLEQGRRLQTIAFDKTGTLTHGKPVLTDVIPINGFSVEEVLRIAASLNVLSEHPIAAAVIAEYGNQSYARVSAFSALPGHGVQGVIDNVLYYIGNRRLINTLNICSLALEATLNRLEAEAKTIVILATSNQIMAVLAVTDTVRASSHTTVSELKTLGVTSIILTGDNEKTAQVIAKQIGVDTVHSNLLPNDKLAIIDTLLTKGSVGMVGDGVNDAPALARADIGFSMSRGGTDTAIEAADVVFMQDDLYKLPEFIRLSHRTFWLLWQNIVIALGIKAVFFFLTMMGYGTLWAAVFADMGASLLVVLNGLRILRQRKIA